MPSVVSTVPCIWIQYWPVAANNTAQITTIATQGAPPAAINGMGQFSVPAGTDLNGPLVTQILGLLNNTLG